jgi:hypothetical protein
MNSCGEPFIIESDKFGPFRGQMLVPDENARRITRVMLEKLTEPGRELPLFFSTPKNCVPEVFGLP